VKNTLGALPGTVIGDAGYGGEENYATITGGVVLLSTSVLIIFIMNYRLILEITRLLILLLKREITINKPARKS
ncbi:hypothetical protein, partial [Paenibacillus tarimensis]|uniref:hypothetical protein n=1 Tax=Paenibacillus tarimensis TaxID=416012 RepID=UPI001F48C1E5